MDYKEFEEEIKKCFEESEKDQDIQYGSLLDLYKLETAYHEKILFKMLNTPGYREVILKNLNGSYDFVSQPFNKHIFHVEKEKKIPASNKRIDLLIVYDKDVYCLELKTFTKEHDSQLMEYKKYCDDIYLDSKGYANHFFFVSLDLRMPEKNSGYSCKTYSNLVKNCLAVDFDDGVWRNVFNDYCKTVDKHCVLWDEKDFSALQRDLQSSELRRIYFYYAYFKHLKTCLIEIGKTRNKEIKAAIEFVSPQKKGGEHINENLTDLIKAIEEEENNKQKIINNKSFLLSLSFKFKEDEKHILTLNRQWDISQEYDINWFALGVTEKNFSKECVKDYKRLIDWMINSNNDRIVRRASTENGKSFEGLLNKGIKTKNSNRHCKLFVFAEFLEWLTVYLDLAILLPNTSKVSDVASWLIDDLEILSE